MPGGWRVVLADIDSRLEPGGPHDAATARSLLVAHLEGRLAALGEGSTAARRADLKLALERWRAWTSP